MIKSTLRGPRLRVIRGGLAAPLPPITTADGCRAVLDAIDEADQRAELARAARVGEVVREPVEERSVVAVMPAPDLDELVRQLWRWAAWACPDGVPPGWREDQRPEGV